MGEVEKISLFSKYLKARLSDGFREQHLAANTMCLGVREISFLIIKISLTPLTSCINFASLQLE